MVKRLALLLLGLVLVACSSTQTPTPAPTETPPLLPTRTPRPTPTPRPPTPTPKPTPIPRPSGLTRYDPIPMGESVMADNRIVVTVLEVERNAWPMIYEYNMFNPEPGPGMEYIIVTLGASNLGDPAETQLVSAWYFRVVGERGTIYDSSLVVLEKYLSIELFGGGGQDWGQVAFQVGQGEKNLVLIYDPGLGSTARYLSLGNSQKGSAATATPIPSWSTQPTVEIIPTPVPITLPTSCDTVTEIPQAECQALVVLYSSTNGANWKNNDGWLQTNTPCTWYSVKCQAHHVTELNLLGNNLEGTIPSELDRLTELQVLDLWGNRLKGDIPSALGHLMKMRTFRVYGNLLTGTIPPELGNLIYLQNLTLSSNRLSGNIPPELGKLVNLQELHLHSNQLSGGVPFELGNLTNLWKLHIANNSQLNGPLPKSFMKLDKLSFFYYGGTKLCAPGDAAFQTWLDSIKDLQTSGLTCP